MDEKDIVQRLLSVKNHGYSANKKNAHNFAISRRNFHFSIFSKLFGKIKFADSVKSLLDQADIPWQVDTFIIFSLILCVIPLVLGLLFLPVIALLAPLGLFLPFLYIRYKIKKRTDLFTQQLPDALDLLCNALRAGHSLFSAFEIIVNEMPDPISRVFKIMTDEIALGVDTKDAMRALQETVPNSVDLRFFTTVVILQREIGGNLIKLLEILAATIRERFKMIGQLKAQTMQAKLSGVIVSVIPPVIAVILFFMAPEYMDYLIHHTWGKISLGVSIFLMIVGFILINKITDIEI
ncbi:MAG: type II secretion system F family protein [Candidatus Gastranaerophilales bacterium]|nr:type II secretion system F family protein [Candidatus Gastranaerophilales bacterium]